mgnify:CR=1 FL=1
MGPGTLALGIAPLAALLDDARCENVEFDAPPVLLLLLLTVVLLDNRPMAV